MSLSGFLNLYQSSFIDATSQMFYHRQQGDFALAGDINYELTDCYLKIHSILQGQDPADVQESLIKREVDDFNTRWKAVQFSRLMSPKEQYNYLEAKYTHRASGIADHQILSKYLNAVEIDKKELEQVKNKFNIKIKSKSFTDPLDLMDYKLQKTKEKIKTLKSLQKIWMRKKLDETAAKVKMLHNALKAVVECRSNLNKIPYVESFASPKEALDLLLSEPVDEVALPSVSTIFFGEAQGVRSAMEDARFCVEDEKRILTGVFDGHGGDAVSKSICVSFLNEFDHVLEKCQGNVHEAFEQIFYETQKKLKETKKHESFHAGSTAVVSYVDKKTRLVYTATLGDSEANIYRIVNGTMKSICLSTIRDWGSQKDANRIAIYYSNPGIAEEWPKHRNPKYLRSGIFDGVNVSRAFGDLQHAGKEKKPLVICKPKITLNKLKEGDILLLACDGLKDYVPENAIIKTLKNSSGNIAQHLVDQAIKDWHSQDNVTVVAVKIPERFIKSSNASIKMS